MNLTSRGNGKRNLESDVRMLLSATICGIWCYHVAISCASEELEKKHRNIKLSSKKNKEKHVSVQKNKERK